MSRIKLDATTYSEPKTVDGELFEVIVGDDKQLTFEPQVKVQRWSNDANFSARLVPPDGAVATVIEEADKLRYSSAAYEGRFYRRDAWGNSAYEFDVVLRQRPKSNRLEWTVQSKNLVAHYQPALTAEEIAEGDERPAHVVGSYALYHASKKNNQYRTGKAFHIFRPLVTDSRGDTVWGDLALDLAAGTMSVTVDQGWLDRATYPVTVDPTFGETGVGGTQGTVPSGYVTAKFASTSEDGTVDTGHSYGRRSAGGPNTDVRFGVWVESSGAEVDTSAAVLYDDGSTQEWHTFTLNSASITNGTSYALGIVRDAGNVTNNYDAGSSGDGGYDPGMTYGDPLSDVSTPWSVTNRIYSDYVTYTASGTTATIGLATETDSAFAHGVGLGFDVGLATEADSAFAVTRDVGRAIGLSTATEQAFAVTVGHGRDIGLASSTESAFDVSKALQYSIGLATEADTAFAISTGIVAEIGLSSSTESAFAMSLEKGYAIGLATETDSAFAMTVAGAVVIGLASEADTALAVAKGLGYGIGLASEADTALGVTLGLGFPIGLASESDSAFAVSKGLGYDIGLALEADTAFALIVPQTAAIGLALETDSAFAFTIDTGAPTVVGVGYTLRDGLGHYALVDGLAHYTLREDDRT